MNTINNDYQLLLASFQDFKKSEAPEVVLLVALVSNLDFFGLESAPFKILSFLTDDISETSSQATDEVALLINDLFLQIEIVELCL